MITEPESFELDYPVSANERIRVRVTKHGHAYFGENISNGNLLGVFARCDFCRQWVWLDRTGSYARTPSEKICCYNCREKSIVTRIEINVPPEYTFASLSQYSRVIQKRLVEWPSKIKRLCITGCPGAGKTNACWAQAKRLAQGGCRLEVHSAVDVKSKWKREFNASVSYTIFDQLRKITFLAFDDLPAVKPGEGWAEEIHGLLDERIRTNRPTIITLSCDPSALTQDYSPAIISRLQMFDEVRLPAKDWRRTGKNKHV